MDITCFVCGEQLGADGLEELGDTFLVHVRAEHELPYPDQGVRNYAEATQRLTGPSERVDRIDDWLAFFDHDAFVGKPEWVACYCLEPHVTDPTSAPPDDPPHWSANRAAMVERLRSGGAYGYLGYVDGRAAGWVNASQRSDYTMFRRGPGAEPADEQVVGVSCFIVAPPYRQHGIAARLLDRVLREASKRGASWVEAYPFKEGEAGQDPSFRGARSLYESRGFEQVTERERDIVMRRRP